MSKKVITGYGLEGNPDMRILLINIARHFECQIFAKGYYVSVGGTLINVEYVRSVFNLLRMSSLLKQSIVVAEFPQLNPKHVETEFMKAFVNRCCEYLSGMHRNFSVETLYALAGVNHAEFLFTEDSELISYVF